MTLRLWMNTRILRPLLGLVWVREVDDDTDEQVAQYVKRHRPEEWSGDITAGDRPDEGLAALLGLASFIGLVFVWVLS